jgi:2'-5' RNA ligase
MRLFIAIDFKKQEDYFKELQKQIPEDTAKVKKVKEFHLTLKFLGEVNEKDLAQIKQALAKIKFNSFKTNLSDLGFFPSEAYIKVVWVGFKPNEPLIKLQQQVEKALDKFNIRKDFKFLPHLTLARVKFVKEKEKFIEAIKKIKTKKQEVEITNFKLIKSELTRQGPIYTDLSTFS